MLTRREQIWYNMLECKFRAYYFEEVATRYRILDRRFNIFLALTASGSVASWAIWKTLEFIWALVIASSTVVNVIKPYFPFHRYVKEVDKTAAQLNTLHLDFESLWFKIDLGKMDEDAVFQDFMELKKRSVQILNAVDETIITENSKIEASANAHMKAYLKNNFDIDHEAYRGFNVLKSKKKDHVRKIERDDESKKAPTYKNPPPPPKKERKP